MRLWLQTWIFEINFPKCFSTCYCETFDLTFEEHLQTRGLGNVIKNTSDLFHKTCGVFTNLHKAHDDVVQINVAQCRMIFALPSNLVQQQVPAVHRRQEILVFPACERNRHWSNIMKDSCLRSFRTNCALNSWTGWNHRQIHLHSTHQDVLRAIHVDHTHINILLISSLDDTWPI